MRILRYIFISSLALLLPLALQAQTSNKDEKNPWAIKGVSLSGDIFGYAYSMLDDYKSVEAALSVNLGNRFFPTVEVGYGSTDNTDETTHIYYKSAAPYYRVGLNYNFLHKKEGALKNYKLLGIARYGWTKTEYDVQTPPITDPVWGGSTAIDLKGVESACSWFELGVGVQVKVWKIFHMGWSIRYKTRLKEGNGPNSEVWYIPGYGENKSSCFGGTYNLIIDIPFSKN